MYIKIALTIILTNCCNVLGMELALTNTSSSLLLKSYPMMIKKERVEVFRQMLQNYDIPRKEWKPIIQSCVAITKTKWNLRNDLPVPCNIHDKGRTLNILSAYLKAEGIAVDRINITETENMAVTPAHIPYFFDDSEPNVYTWHLYLDESQPASIQVPKNSPDALLYFVVQSLVHDADFNPLVIVLKKYPRARDCETSSEWLRLKQLTQLLPMVCVAIKNYGFACDMQRFIHANSSLFTDKDINLLTEILVMQWNLSHGVYGNNLPSIIISPPEEDNNINNG